MVRAAPGTALRAEHALAPFARASERRELKRWTLALDEEQVSRGTPPSLPQCAQRWHEPGVVLTGV
jgi:hypothetical protein